MKRVTSLFVVILLLVTMLSVPGVARAADVLTFVNHRSTTFEVLDVNVGLDSRAAHNIIAHRDGPDGIYGTADDNPFDSRQELDDVPYVGPTAMSKLENYAATWTPPTSTGQPPVLSPIGNKTVNEGSLLTFTVSATDPDGDPLTYSVQGLPSGATFANQTFSWAPTYDQAGTYTVTFKVTDGTLEDSETITITVYDVAPALAESPHPYSNNFDQTWSISGGGAENMRIHFSRLEVEKDYDHVYIYDNKNTLTADYTGSYADLWTPWIATNTIKVRLTTDSSITAYGFTVDKKETAALAPPSTPTAKKYAVVVGINDYATINDLNFAVNDALDWKNYLVGKGYTINSFLTDSQARENNIKAAIANVIATADNNSTVVFAFSGHGAKSDEVGLAAGRFVICCHDSGSGSTGNITDTELQGAFSGFGGKLFIFLDSCRSGGMNEAVSSDSNKVNRYMTTTCGANGYGYDEPNYQNGAWTYWYLEKGLVGQKFTAAEPTFTWALKNYPYSGDDAPLQFDGNTADNFNMNP